MRGDQLGEIAGMRRRQEMTAIAYSISDGNSDMNKLLTTRRQYGRAAIKKLRAAKYSLLSSRAPLVSRLEPP
jgi:hypothetical protein